MGTRADFYVGRGLTAEWIGSIAWDGYPEGIQPREHNKRGEFVSGRHLFDAKTKEEFTERVNLFFEGRDDVTLPADGWPWPWENSQTTDYSYAFDDGKVWASCFGCEWFDPKAKLTDEEHEALHEGPRGKSAVFPQMSTDRFTMGKRSGVIVIG